MRILHVNDVAGVACDLRDFQRFANHSTTLMAKKRYCMCEPDVPLFLDGLFGINLELLSHLKSFKQANIVHIHSGIRSTHFVLPFIRKSSKGKWILHYHGSETRLGYGMAHEDLADLKLVSTPDLLKWHKDAIWLPVPIPEIRMGPVEVKIGSAKKLRIGHFPSNRAIKGTDKIVRAIQPLIESGKAELIIVEGKPKVEAMNSMRTMDLVIDQLNELEIFSKVALEAMAQGIPALSSYNPDIFPGDCPVLRVTKETDLARILEDLSASGIDGHLRERSREYVVKYHDPMKVVAQLESLYLDPS